VTVRISVSGHLIAQPGDKGDEIIDFILSNEYKEECIVSESFSPRFVAELMRAGFLIMSIRSADAIDDSNAEYNFLLLPKHHLVRSILDFDNAHISRSVKRFMPRYELRINTDYDEIVAKCVEKHGADWLTPPLLRCMRHIRQMLNVEAQMVSFGVYREGRLAAGEFGVAVGGVYTSYSGYYDETSAGRVQMLKTSAFLKEHGFAFWDLGMPLPYKYTLGACDIDTRTFITRFRAARSLRPTLT
jgi:leucyl/phenylalanyl-tRNA--protein transferase